MSEKVDVIVVGAGLAGLGAAYHLAGAGLDVLVVERGDYPGSKNVSGGRLYLHPVRPYFPELFAEANLREVPFERRVVKERLTVVAESSTTTLEHHAPKWGEDTVHSVTVLRSVFDRWLGDVVAEQGGMVISGYKVDDLVWEGERVNGIVSAGDQVLADVVIAADGALSFVAEKAGLRKRHDPHHFALGIKEVIELPADKINDRFGVVDGEGVAQLFFGQITHGMMGGGFLYTNRESVSLGIVLGMGAMREKGAAFQAHELIEAFRCHPEVASLVSEGELVEYSAHAIPEISHRAMPRLVLDGLLVVGDAAGLALNLGITVRGMDFALVSGAMAAQAILEAKAEGDFSARSLSRYEESLRNSFVLRDQRTFDPLMDFLENPRLYDFYPEVIANLLQRLFWIGEDEKPRLWKAVMGTLREVPLMALLQDMWQVRRL
jgi:electron transfer flavoprotein-quinone oxidoreductase